MLSTLSPYDVLSAGKWRSALFTTFSLSLSFFEAVPLHALRRAGAQEISILADLVGYQASLAESGVADVGRTYDLVPLRATTGCFHPKVIVLEGEAGMRATVGSGNLTFGGWGFNIETVDYLAPEQVPEAFADLAEFLEYLDLHIQEGRIVVPNRPASVLAMAESCRRAARAAGSGRTRILHSFAGPIASQLATWAEDLGGATEITVVSPFFGSPEPVRDLAVALGCERVRVCVTGRAPEFFDFSGARAIGLEAHPVRSEAFLATKLLHAKVIEVICRSGRLILSGSANSTRPALITADNVEASVLRVVDDRSLFGWTAADPRSLEEGEGGVSDPLGGPCLSARFDGVMLTGRLFGQPRPGGLWQARLVSGPTHLGLPDVAVEEDGTFSVKAGAALSFSAFRATQIILGRVGYEIRGWVIFDQVLGAVQERGPLAEAMIRMLGGSEESDDLSVILSFFAINPTAFLQEDVGAPTTGGRGEGQAPSATGVVDLARLRPSSAFGESVGAVAPVGGVSAFERLLMSVRQHVRDAEPPRTALADAEELGEGEQIQGRDLGAISRWHVEAAIEALTGFIERLTGESPDFRRHSVSLLDFILFAAERSDAPADLKAAFLPRWIGLVRRGGRGAAEHADVLDRAFLAVLVSRVMDDPARATRTHAWLQEWCGGDLGEVWVASAMPAASGIREKRLQPAADDKTWAYALDTMTATRTGWMNVRRVQLALAGDGLMPDLPAALVEETAAIQRVLDGKSRPDRVMTMSTPSNWPACERCYRQLPVLARERIREHRIALAPCCARVLLNPFLD